mgnify:CR=1 FL=1
MFSSKQTLVVPEIHGEQNANTANLGQVPNLELESEPGHMIQEDGDKFDLQFGRMALGSSTTFPAGHVIQTSTPTIITGSGAYSAGRTRLGSLDIWYHDASKITNSITKQQGTSSFLLVHYNVTRRFIGSSGAHSHVIFIDASTYIANNDDFNRVSGSQARMISGSAPFLNLAAGSYTFTHALARGTDNNMEYQMNARSATDGITDSLCSSWMYIQEIAG